MKKIKLLDLVSEYFEVHATIGVAGHKKFTVPSYVKNHGVLQREPLMQLLRSTKVDTAQDSTVYIVSLKYDMQNFSKFDHEGGIGFL